MTARTAKVPETRMSLAEMKAFIGSHFEGFVSRIAGVNFARIS